VGVSARLTAEPHGPMRFSNEDDVMPDLDPNRKRRNWLVLVVLGALAVLLYVAVMLKFAGYRF
jgi:hypothetical protein